MYIDAIDIIATCMADGCLACDRGGTHNGSMQESRGVLYSAYAYWEYIAMDIYNYIYMHINAQCTGASWL